MPRPATIRISVAMIGCMPTLATRNPFHSPHSAATPSAAAIAGAHRHVADMGLLAVLDRQRAADQQRGERGRDGDHRADRDVDAARGDDERHAQRDQDQRRGAVEDVDQAAVEVAVAPLQAQEARVEGGIDHQQQEQRDDRPQQRVFREPAHHAARSVARGVPGLCHACLAIMSSTACTSLPPGSSPALRRSRMHRDAVATRAPPRRSPTR